MDKETYKILKRVVNILGYVEIEGINNSDIIKLDKWIEGEEQEKSDWEKTRRICGWGK